jgi:hypothetical protein
MISSVLMMTIIAVTCRLMISSATRVCSRRLAGWLCIILLCALTAGCAATSTTVMDEEVITNQKHMSSYKSLIIRDFELQKELYTDSSDARMSDREQRYAQMPSLLAENIERYVKSRHTYRNVSRNGQPTATTLVLKGRFTRVGRFRISIVGTLHDGASDQEVAFFRQTLWDVFDTTESINLLSREIADFIDRIQYK